MNKMFKNILVANRGEIACRVIKTARRMGLQTHAIFHHVDRKAPHVEMADFAHELEADIPVSAYLDIEQILAIAKTAGIESIHPGYGFLSENSVFAEEVERNNIEFIGPNAQSIVLLGDKIRSRQTAIEAGVPVSPSIEFKDDQNIFVEKCQTIGFPLLIKASAGGGGKGMQIVTAPDELVEKLDLSRREAMRYFGDDRVYAESYISRPRHIEVQILGDGKGNIVHVYERECSIQRRFQKIIEESPAPNLNEKLREEICNSACKLAKRLNYRNAGTVEFILSDKNEYYFLEMNTRLQVEHPVTELVCGLDLVEEQILIASNRSLSFRQKEIEQNGHAIESRICCEEPLSDFAPATGKVEKLHLPEINDVRYDVGFSEGQQITSDFDSMIGKLICFGVDRTAAVKKCIEAIGEVHILGVETNLNFLLSIFKSDAFQKGNIDTGFVSDNAELLNNSGMPDEMIPVAVILATLENAEIKRLILETSDLHSQIGTWRN